MPGVVSTDQTLPQEGRKGQGTAPRGSWRHGPLLDQRREADSSKIYANHFDAAVPLGTGIRRLERRAEAFAS
jgi:hypothetical protein